MSLWKKIKGAFVAEESETKKSEVPAAQPVAPVKAVQPTPAVQPPIQGYGVARTGPMNPMPSPSVPKPVTAKQPEVNLKKFENRKFMELSIFQFKNLINKPVMFAFFDLRDQTQNPVRIAKAMPISSEEAFNSIAKFCPNFDYPIVAICERGDISKALAEKLSDKGYKNVAILAGGTHWLKSQSESGEAVVEEED